MSYVEFTGEETEKEFLEKCVEQWELAANSQLSDIGKLMRLASVFSEMRHRIEELE